jgi:hypothetical protein
MEGSLKSRCGFTRRTVTSRGQSPSGGAAKTSKPSSAALPAALRTPCELSWGRSAYPALMVHTDWTRHLPARWRSTSPTFSPASRYRPLPKRYEPAGVKRPHTMASGGSLSPQPTYSHPSRSTASRSSLPAQESRCLPSTTASIGQSAGRLSAASRPFSSSGATWQPGSRGCSQLSTHSGRWPLPTAGLPTGFPTPFGIARCNGSGNPTRMLQGWTHSPFVSAAVN